MMLEKNMKWKSVESWKRKLRTVYMKKIHCTHVYISEKMNLNNLNLKRKNISFS